MDHKTENIVVKRADVDKGIIPVVNWLNSYQYINTLAACQGDDDRDGEPYVVFIVRDTLELTNLLAWLGPSKCRGAWVEVSWHDHVLYWLKFTDVEALAHFVSRHLPAPFAVEQHPEPTSLARKKIADTAE